MGDQTRGASTRVERRDLGVRGEHGGGAARTTRKSSGYRKWRAPIAATSWVTRFRRAALAPATAAPATAAPKHTPGAPAENVVKFYRKVPNARREHSVIRLPSFEQVSQDAVLYAHASRILHMESNPGNARALVQRHGIACAAKSFLPTTLPSRSSAVWPAMKTIRPALTSTT